MHTLVAYNCGQTPGNDMNPQSCMQKSGRLQILYVLCQDEIFIPRDYINQKWIPNQS